ncbi:MAG TPA: hypothetical protein VKU02_29080 [Gemmataceae bacterium]|nr:hypothetical protein [Gemmataceae bacterium]
MKNPSQQSPQCLPNREQELELHRRLVAGDCTASAELAQAFFNPLIEWLVRHNCRLEEDLCNAAAVEALYALMKNPRSYDPCREKAIGLFGYLQLSAQRDVQNLLRQERRHQRARKTWESVEQSPLAEKYLGREEDPSLPLQRKESAQWAAAHVLPAVRAGLTPTELRVLDLLLQGERKTAVYVEACGLGHLSIPQQRALVKRLKDKLNQRIKRTKSGHEASS